MRHIQQECLSSCGVATAAMLSWTTFAEMRVKLEKVRSPSRLANIKRPYINVAEMRALLAAHGMEMGKRTQGVPPQDVVAVVRTPNSTVSGWHWSAWERGMLYDPMKTQGHMREPRGGGVSYYAVTGY